ncbi:stress responsive alpha-beta barrel domain-containing protein [Terrimonas sp.]|uniref:Dabb family protein n=1 Tax=Terrimonas sp. TaxID=1914338 RepID=UPI000D524039|nr:Dabb family protein [Terrimonas sp.]PVD52325.1 stress responsive alpha-beta barrel domain-containing protein [Terrimonas sp.]
MIRHSVIFKLKHHKGSQEEALFLEKANALSSIPGIQNFECLKQVSPKNKFDFGISMAFENETLYQQYNNHPDHVYFVQQYWLKEVEDFLEIDYVPYT